MAQSVERGGRRSRSPQGKGAHLREELMAAADRLLARSGDEAGLTLRAVAREAGVAAPSVYLHFAGKDDLLWAVMLGHFAAFGRALAAATTGAPSPAAGLRAGCLAYCRFAVDHPGSYRVMFGNTTTGFPEESWGEIPGSDTFEALVSGVAASMASGEAPAGDPLRVASGVWTALHGIVTLRWSVPMFPWPPVEELVEDALVGLVGLAPVVSVGPAEVTTAEPASAPGTPASAGERTAGAGTVGDDRP